MNFLLFFSIISQITCSALSRKPRDLIGYNRTSNNIFNWYIGKAIGSKQKNLDIIDQIVAADRIDPHMRAHLFRHQYSRVSNSRLQRFSQHHLNRFKRQNWNLFDKSKIQFYQFFDRNLRLKFYIFLLSRNLRINVNITLTVYISINPLRWLNDCNCKIFNLLSQIKRLTWTFFLSSLEFLDLYSKV